MTMRAIWQGRVLAETDDTVVVEGNHYFPVSSLAEGVFTETATHTVCPWKGTASYYDITVDGTTESNAAWYYPAPKEKAAEIKDHVAFYGVVTVS